MVQDAEIDRNGRSRRADRRALSRTGRPLVCSAIVAASLVIYFVMTLPRLGVFPPVGEDEPWIAAAPYKLATDGVLGSDLFAGYYGMERHHYAHLPLFPLAQAAIFKLAGVGVVPMRALPVAFGALLLCAVFVVGRQAGGDRVGAIAMALMVVLRITAGGAATGILLLDRARINRYDIAVPVFGLAALWAFNRWEYTRRRLWIAIAGSLAALATLSHLYGVFWLPLLVGLLIARHGRRAHRDLIALAAGFAAPCLPWLAFIATGWTDFLGQMRMTAGRFDLLNPSFYVDNMFRGDGPISLGWAARTIASLPLTRIGTWTMLAGGAGACVAMLALTRRRDADPGRTLAIACLAQTAMFAALLKVKIVAYMIALWPLWAVLVAWLAVRLWDRGAIAVRAALVALAVAVAGESSARAVTAWKNAGETGAYAWYESQIAGCIPPGSRVLGLQHYWLGLRQYPYRTWLLPILLAQPPAGETAIAFDAALERVDPDVVLLDRYIDDLMRTAADPRDPNHRLYVGFEAFKARRRVRVACVVRDHTYGTMQVLTVPRFTPTGARGAP